MTDSPNLQLPEIESRQKRKYEVHNDALYRLDTLVQLAVLDRDLAAPPVSPTAGQRWIVAASASGAWSGRADDIAAWQDGAWQFSTPKTGWVAYVVDEGTLLVWNGTAWGDFFSTVTAIQNLVRLGIGTTADLSNPFSAKLNNALWTARTVAEGGDGNIRYKFSKEKTAATASLLFQNNFSGRAEVGLTGDDSLHVKMSADGTTWVDALQLSSTGALAMSSSAASSSSTSGALTVPGGIGVGGGIVNAGNYAMSGNTYIYTFQGSTYGKVVAGLQFDGLNKTVGFYTNEVWRGNLGSMGFWRWAAYGAGTLVTDSSGNVTSSSDAALKDYVADFDRSIADLRKIGKAVVFDWNEISGLNGRQAGWMLRDGEGLAVAFPEAVGRDSQGFMTLHDRPILAACVAGVIEADDKVAALAADVAALAAELAEAKLRIASLEGAAAP